MKVLLVDDSRASRALTATYLLEMGHPAIEAGDGEAALAMYRKENPDVILLDVEMPGMDGYAAAREIRRLDRDGAWTPIIFLSGRVGDEDIARGIDAGGDDYITKPVSPVVLRAKLLAMRRITEMRKKLVEVSQQLQDVNRALVKLSSQDGLTGLANRRAFDTAMELEWQRGLRSDRATALLLGDLDYFKRYNDHYGHQAGDNCLQMVAAALAARARRVSDVAARIGGEEFALLLPETALPEALQQAEELLESIRALDIAHVGSEVAPHVTMSVGVAVCVPSASFSWERLLQTADKALYQAKAEGRDRYAFQRVVV
ncbi:MAG: diguanylate cyclase [Nevskia sp.]|nr:diguanylate cyclase [Nevskia sp.]